MILAFGRSRQEDHGVILSYIASLGYMTSNLQTNTQNAPPPHTHRFSHSAPERQGFAGKLKVGSKAVWGAEGKWQRPKD